MGNMNLFICICFTLEDTSTNNIFSVSMREKNVTLEPLLLYWKDKKIQI